MVPPSLGYFGEEVLVSPLPIDVIKTVPIGYGQSIPLLQHLWLTEDPDFAQIHPKPCSVGTSSSSAVGPTGALGVSP